MNKKLIFVVLFFMIVNDVLLSIFIISNFNTPNLLIRYFVGPGIFACYLLVFFILMTHDRPLIRKPSGVSNEN